LVKGEREGGRRKERKKDEILLVESLKKLSIRLQKKMTKRCAQLCEANLPKLFERGEKGSAQDNLKSPLLGVSPFTRTIFRSNCSTYPQ
jgi:hypothetical protein